MTEIITIDARGLICPQPVLETKKTLEQSRALRFLVLVDNAAARENVSRFARSQGCVVEVKKSDTDEAEIMISRSTASSIPEHQEDLLPCPIPQTAPSVKNVIYIGSNSIGSGDDELGEKLMRGFLRTCIDVVPLPWRIVFMNSGVKLAAVDDEAVDALIVLQEKGVEILSCGTCLQHFGLQDRLRVGRVTNMFEIVESFTKAAKVISPD